MLVPTQFSIDSRLETEQQQKYGIYRIQGNMYQLKIISDFAYHNMRINPLIKQMRIL
jgi:hypothetical protein